MKTSILNVGKPFMFIMAMFVFAACSNGNKTFVGKTYSCISSSYELTAKFINENECNLNISSVLGGGTYMMYYDKGKSIDPKIQMYYSDKIELLKDGKRSWVGFEEYRKELNTWDATFKDFAILLYDPQKDELTFLNEDDFDAVFYNDWYKAYKSGEVYDTPVMDCVIRTESFLLKRVK